VLTLAQGDSPLRLDRELDRAELGSRVGTVTERLILRAAAAAPVVRARLELENGRESLRDLGIGHEVLLRVSSQGVQLNPDDSRSVLESGAGGGLRMEKRVDV
jgi:hypothetical protein